MIRRHRTVRTPYSPVASSNDVLRSLQLNIPNVATLEEGEDLLQYEGQSLNDLPSITIGGLSKIGELSQSIWGDQPFHIIVTIKNPLLKRYATVFRHDVLELDDSVVIEASDLAAINLLHHLHVDLQIATPYSNSIVTRSFRRIRIECDVHGFTFPKLRWTNDDFLAMNLGADSVYFIDGKRALEKDFSDPEDLDSQIANLYTICIRDTVLDVMDMHKQKYAPLLRDAATQLAADICARVANATTTGVWGREFSSGSVGAFIKFLSKHASLEPEALLLKVSQSPFWAQAFVQDLVRLKSTL